MDDFILQARLNELEQHGDLEKMGNMVQQGKRSAIGDVFRGAGQTYMNWANARQPVQPDPNAPAPDPNAPAPDPNAPAPDPNAPAQTESARGGILETIGSAPGRMVRGITNTLSGWGEAGQQARTGLTPEQQKAHRDRQKATNQATQTAQMHLSAADRGMPIDKNPEYKTALGQMRTQLTDAGDQAVAPPAQPAQPAQPAPPVQPGQPQTDANGDGVPDAPAQTPGQQMVGASQAQRANQMANTSFSDGGFGTGLLSNVLTGGLAGAGRALYNMRQRRIGRDAQRDIQAGRQPTWKSEYDGMDDVYDTISIRKGIQARNTTEALRNGLR